MASTSALLTTSKDPNQIKLTKTDPAAGGKHHLVPADWVERVDAHVHLNAPMT
jgi:hypothetical protein